MELYIVRHGETLFNASKHLQGNLDIELNEKGKEAAEKLGESLKEIPFDCIYSSPLVRAIKTAEAVQKYQKCPLVLDKRLEELCFGVMQGKPLSEWLGIEGKYGDQLKKDPAHYLPPENGESIPEIKERVSLFVKEVLENCGLNRVMVVAHGITNQSLCSVLENLKDEDFWKSPLQKNCEATIYEYDGQRWKRK